MSEGAKSKWAKERKRSRIRKATNRYNIILYDEGNWRQMNMGSQALGQEVDAGASFVLLFHFNTSPQLFTLTLPYTLVIPFCCFHFAAVSPAPTYDCSCLNNKALGTYKHTMVNEQWTRRKCLSMYVCSIVWFGRALLFDAKKSYKKRRRIQIDKKNSYIYI